MAFTKPGTKIHHEIDFNVRFFNFVAFLQIHYSQSYETSNMKGWDLQK